MRVISFVMFVAPLLFLKESCAQTQNGTRLICFGDAFVTRLFSTLLERNRENLARNEPNKIGDRVENIGLFVLHSPRAYNLSTTKLHGSITVDCSSNSQFAKIRIPVSITEFVFIYDYIFPGHLTYGRVIVTSDYLGMVVYLEVPLEARSLERIMLTDTEIFRSDDFKLSFTGLGPVTRALSAVMYAAYRVTPQIPLQLYESLSNRALQRYLDIDPLPL